MTNKKNFFLFITITILITTLLLYAQNDRTKTVEDYEKSCNDIRSLIQNSNIWENAYFYKDEKMVPTITGYLDIAATLKIEGLENFLVEKIDYTPYTGKSQYKQCFEAD
ncbi:MAG: hypothetical protein HZA48_03065 [Planctomycetes bacterium]|nr:hypothetical protein [Planctomycetota bacterium]